MATGVFERVVVGVDGSDESREAVRQAVRLLAPEGTLRLVTAVEVGKAAGAGFAATRAADQLAAEATAALEAAKQLAPRAQTMLVKGGVAAALRAAIERERATLVCLGSHGRGRLAGMMLGHVVAGLLHDAPCAVLVARPARVPEAFPRVVVAGLDGSPEAVAAGATAAELAERLGATVRHVLATGGKGVDLDAARAETADVEIDERSPVDALVAAAADADLLVVGSRGLHGVKALGSVSERVAHRAPCSVLVVRPA